MYPLSAIFSLLVGAAGWHYLFYSTAAQSLVAVEDTPMNRQRVRLRRVGGFVMLALAACFFAGFWAFDFDRLDRAGGAFAAVWLAVCVLIAAVLVLAIVDLRLTLKLRRRRRAEATEGRP